MSDGECDIDVRDTLTADDFLSDYLSVQRPVKIRNAFNGLLAFTVLLSSVFVMLAAAVMCIWLPQPTSSNAFCAGSLSHFDINAFSYVHACM